MIVTDKKREVNKAVKEKEDEIIIVGDLALRIIEKLPQKKIEMVKVSDGILLLPARAIRLLLLSLGSFLSLVTLSKIKKYYLVKVQIQGNDPRLILELK